jgi:hypothetical protein
VTEVHDEQIERESYSFAEVNKKKWEELKKENKKICLYESLIEFAREEA